jgi:hypothetical protein
MQSFGHCVSLVFAGHIWYNEERAFILSAPLLKHAARRRDYTYINIASCDRAKYLICGQRVQQFRDRIFLIAPLGLEPKAISLSPSAQHREIPTGYKSGSSRTDFRYYPIN